MSLDEYGWSESFAAAFVALDQAAWQPGRVIASASGEFRVMTDAGEIKASLAGSVRHAATSAAEFPAVGDWVVMHIEGDGSARIERILERRTSLSRRAVGKRDDEQVVAANVDVVLIVMGLDGDYSLRRLERLVTLVWESGARPVVLLNKRDICPEYEARLTEVEQAAPDVTVLVASCLVDDQVEAVREQIAPHETAVMIGSSGAGKSTLINRLLGSDVQRTREVREGDDRGRHTTTHRELFRLAHGGLLIDSPGIREVQLWSTPEALDRAFDDVVQLAAACRFRDCGHVAEVGCAVQAAVRDGTLTAERLTSYRKLHAELEYLELRQNDGAQRTQKRKWRTIHKEKRRSSKHRKR